MTPRPQERDIVIALAKELCARRAGGVAGLLDPQVALVVDNGGEAELGMSAVGRLACADELVRIVSRAPGCELSVANVNGSLGIVAHAGGSAAAVVIPRVRRGVVADLWAVVAPDKLDSWSGPPPKTPEG